MERTLVLDTHFLEGAVSGKDMEKVVPLLDRAHSMLEGRNGPGNGFLGWMDLPKNTPECLVEDIVTTASALKKISSVMVVVGIGGSYLGARAAIGALSPSSVWKNVMFAGNNISGEHLLKILERLENAEVSINVISKSGTTTEPAIAFRCLQEALRKKYGHSGLRDRVVCTTDSARGALKKLADREGYKTFVIPDDVGGRFSVLTPVGLLPMAFAGIDISKMIKGAADMADITSTCDIDRNLSYRYAVIRKVLYDREKKIEILSSFHTYLHYVSEWWKQLFGESEGKSGHGIFPAACDFSTDLHSMGQLIQEGERNIFETFLTVETENTGCAIPHDDEDLDGLNYLEGRDLGFINRKAYEATAEAHFEGGVPNLTIAMPEKNAYYLGQLFYFFEKAVAVSGYMLGVNPFDQPGVEAYKKKMFRLLGKPGS
ncbi:MAG: glucose-6-phosphate isomerase [Candidatus Omnitrophica bacterium]|nr:glucose-6-phosphate isomerase [Candidatus Omnitrophota bacterium]MDD5487544.1 glucose-6-phosphate isomerase [Candidatus Omnitrophota bacterium]